MNFEVVVRPLAERDLEEAQRWYEGQWEGLGDRFRHEFDQPAIRLSETPRIYPIVHRRLHRAVMARFPYLVYFSITPSTVVIVACLHSSRSPDLLRLRSL